MKNKEALIIFFVAAFASAFLFSHYDYLDLTGRAVEWDSVSGITTNWQVEETLETGSCSGSTIRESYPLIIVHKTGSKVEAISDRFEINGLFRNNLLNLFGSFPDNDGTTKITSAALKISEDCEALTGTFDWEWNNGTTECEVTSKISGTRTDNGRCPVLEAECIEDWKCDEWNTCSAQGKKSRKCADANSCSTAEQKPEEEQDCDYAAPKPPVAAPKKESATPAPKKERLDYTLVGGAVASALIAAWIIWHFFKKSKSKKK